MRCVIARYPFELTKNGVLDTMKDVKPEPVTAGAYVTIGRRRYPAKQVGRVITRQDPRDFTAREVVQAMTRLGFTCNTVDEAPPVVSAGPVERASALLGSASGGLTAA
ncbi:SCO5918 family protein [Streptomyces sp.]|uniref:SCO5918 family protein n=1 Tax=Streptomyces sp. TaxID=1931 RepID=UPI00281142A2|nr:SCO5918 family protein [Streptomyces sp.]